MSDQKEYTPKLTLIRGLVASGKTTWAKALKTLDTDHWETNMFFYDAEGKYSYNPKDLTQAHEWCQTQVLSSMEGNWDVIVSNTFIKLWEMDPYLELAKKFGYSVEILTATGKFKNIHEVPDDTCRRMRNSWEELPEGYLESKGVLVWQA